MSISEKLNSCNDLRHDKYLIFITLNPFIQYNYTMRI